MDGCNAARKRVKSKLRISLSLSLFLIPYLFHRHERENSQVFRIIFSNDLKENYESSIFL